MNTTQDEILEPMARTLWLCAYADAVENNEIEGPSPGYGEDWDDYAPSTPDEAWTKAGEILALFNAPTIADRWMEDTGQDVDRSGHCLAMQVLGHGVGLGDDYPSTVEQPKVLIPSAEFYIYDVDLDQYDDVSWRED